MVTYNIRKRKHSNSIAVQHSLARMHPSTQVATKMDKNDAAGMAEILHKQGVVLVTKISSGVAIYGREMYNCIFRQSTSSWVVSASQNDRLRSSYDVTGKLEGQLNLRADGVYDDNIRIDDFANLPQYVRHLADIVDAARPLAEAAYHFFFGIHGLFDPIGATYEVCIWLAGWRRHARTHVLPVRA